MIFYFRLPFSIFDLIFYNLVILSATERHSIATTKELWMRAVKFDHLNFFGDRLNDHFHTFSCKYEQSTCQCFVTLRGRLRLGISGYGIALTEWLLFSPLKARFDGTFT